MDCQQWRESVALVKALCIFGQAWVPNSSAKITDLLPLGEVSQHKVLPLPSQLPAASRRAVNWGWNSGGGGFWWSSTKDSKYTTDNNLNKETVAVL